MKKGDICKLNLLETGGYKIVKLCEDYDGPGTSISVEFSDGTAARHPSVNLEPRDTRNIRHMFPRDVVVWHNHPCEVLEVFRNTFILRHETEEEAQHPISFELAEAYGEETAYIKQPDQVPSAFTYNEKQVVCSECGSSCKEVSSQEYIEEKKKHGLVEKPKWEKDFEKVWHKYDHLIEIGDPYSVDDLEEDLKEAIREAIKEVLRAEIERLEKQKNLPKEAVLWLYTKSETQVYRRTLDDQIIHLRDQLKKLN